MLATARVGYAMMGAARPGMIRKGRQTGGQDMSAFKTRLLLGAALVVAAVPATAQNRSRNAPASITMGQSVQGEIAAPRAGQCPAPDPRIRSYAASFAAGTRIQVTLQAADTSTFDPVVEIGKMDGCTFTMLASNDDGDGEEDGLNSRLVATVNTAGDYVIRARALNEEGAGSFTLALSQLPPVPPPPAPTALMLGKAAPGTLTANDPVIDDSAGYAGSYEEYADAGASTDSSITVSGLGRPYHLYSLTGQAGKEYLIKMDSEEFDAYLEAGSNSPLGYSVVASNDDGGGEEDGLNSRLRIKFQTDGTVIIRASPLGNDTGAYTISADIAPPLEAVPMVDAAEAP